MKTGAIGILFLMVLLSSSALPPAQSLECREGSAPLQRNPTAEWFMETEDEIPAAIVTIDPRGVGGFQILEELDFVWIDAENDEGAWDHRGRHGWQGVSDSERCAPRFASEAVLNSDYIEDGIAWVDSKFGDFWVRQFFIFPESVEPDRLHYDVVIEVGNESDADLEGYHQTFSCPTPRLAESDSAQYLDATGKAASWSSEKPAEEKWIVNPKIPSGMESLFPFPGEKKAEVWSLPVLVSGSTPGGWRVVTMLDPNTAAAIGELDRSQLAYAVFPGAESAEFKQGESFVARVRHSFIRSEDPPSPADLKEMFDRFESDWDELDATLMTFVD